MPGVALVQEEIFLSEKEIGHFLSPEQRAPDLPIPLGGTVDHVILVH